MNKVRKGESQGLLRTPFHFRSQPRDFLDGPVSKTLYSQCRGPGSIPDQEARFHTAQLKIAHAVT